jgi:hypothetical protein
MNIIRGEKRPWQLLFDPPPMPLAAPPPTSNAQLVKLAHRLYTQYEHRRDPVALAEVVAHVAPADRYERHICDLLSVLESIGAAALVPQGQILPGLMKNPHGTVTLKGHAGITRAMIALAARSDWVFPMTSTKGGSYLRDGESWRFLSTGLRNAAAAILHLLLRHEGGPLSASMVTFHLWRLIFDERMGVNPGEPANPGLRLKPRASDIGGMAAESTSVGNDLYSGSTQPKSSAWEALGLQAFGAKFASRSITPKQLEGMVAEPDAMRSLLNFQVGLSLPDCEFVVAQMQKAAEAPNNPLKPAPLSATSETNSNHRQSHQTALELERLHRQLREVLEVLACANLRVILMHPRPGDSAPQPAQTDQGARLNQRCGLREVYIQLNTAVFPVRGLPMGCAEMLQMARSKGLQCTPSEAGHRNPALQYCTGQVVCCPRCSLRFRAPQACHSLLCPGCKLPIEEGNVEAYIQAHPEMAPLLGPSEAKVDPYAPPSVTGANQSGAGLSGGAVLPPAPAFPIQHPLRSAVSGAGAAGGVAAFCSPLSKGDTDLAQDLVMGNSQHAWRGHPALAGPPPSMLSPNMTGSQMMSPQPIQKVRCRIAML